MAWFLVLILETCQWRILNFNFLFHVHTTNSHLRKKGEEFMYSRIYVNSLLVLYSKYESLPVFDNWHLSKIASTLLVPLKYNENCVVTNI